MTNIRFQGNDAYYYNYMILFKFLYSRCARPALALTLALTISSAWAQPKPRTIIILDRIVAVVNDEVITRNDLTDRVNFATQQLTRQGTPPPARPELERQILERMIADRAQLQHAKETGLRVDNVELDRAIDRIALENKLSTLQLRSALEREGVAFEKYREEIRDQIVFSRLREREVDDKIVVTESEIDNLLAQESQAGGSDEFNVSHILVTVAEKSGPEQIQVRLARAEQALKQLQSGSDFRQIAATFSESADALQGGGMGWREGERLPALYYEALRNMKPGELSPILRSPNGFHILKLNERRSGKAPAASVQQIRARHILIKSSEIVSENEARNRLRNIKERIDNKEDFAVLARAHSEDSSAGKGGELGWLSPGETVPEFERAMAALTPGQVSEPVRSPFGWHLIQVLERRTQDMTKDRRRVMAQQALRERKSDESYQEWVRQLRDRAYVEIRLEER